MKQNIAVSHDATAEPNLVTPPEAVGYLGDDLITENLKRKKGGSPRQPSPGTRVSCYRCSLPGLTGFAAYRCGEANADRH